MRAFFGATLRPGIEIVSTPLWLQALPQRNGHWIALLLPIHAAFAWAWAKRKA